jgi:hypothetical protein
LVLDDVVVAAVAAAVPAEPASADTVGAAD